MPIKEIIALASMFVIGMAAAHPTDYMLRLRKIEYSILRDAARTDNWGSPSVFPKSHRRFAPVRHVVNIQNQ
jgi:hypothetical protein